MSYQKTIMVVDDNLDIQNIAQAVLEGEGYRVMCADSGADLFDKLEDQKPDLILLDIMLPGMDGLEILRRLRGNPDTSSIPVTMLTVKGEPDDIQQAYELGCDYYLTKPVTGKQIVDSVNQLLRRAERRPQ
ncbi:MAG: response regulator [Deltaproteobacteria bacterium]|nr:response regulator [Deltaproteobacteria bacterium]